MSEGARSVGSEEPWQTLMTSKKYGGRFSGPGRPFSPVSPPPSLTDGKVVSEERPSSPAGSTSSGYVSYRSSAGVGNGRPYSPFRSLSPTERPFASVQGGAGEDSPFSAASSGSESTFTFPERNSRLTRSWSQSSGAGPGPSPSLLDAAPRYESQLQATYGRIRPRPVEAPVIQPQSLPVGGASRKSSTSSSVDFNSLRKISDFTPPQPPPKPVTHTSTLRLKVGNTIEREREQKPDGKDFAMPESGLKYGVGSRKPYGTPFKAESEPLKPRVFNVEYDRLLSSSSTTASDDDAAPSGTKKAVLNGGAPKDELSSSRVQRESARMKFFSNPPGSSETANKPGGVHVNADHEGLQLHEPIKGKTYSPTYGKINRKETKAQKVVPQIINSNVNSYVRESSKYRAGGKVPPMASPESYYEDEEYRDYGKINKPATHGPPPTPPPPPPPLDSDDDNHRIMAELERMELKTASRAQPVRNVREYSERGVLVQEVDEGQPCLECGEKCPGFTPHVWRKTCSSCKCPREAHDVYHEEWVNVSERLGFKLQADSERRASRERSINEGYAWVPPRLTSAQIEKYFAELPPEKVPELGTSGEKYHSKQLTTQLPRQDLALAYCKHVESQHHSSYEDFISARNEIALDFGYVCESEGYTECPQCQKAIGPLELGVVAPKFGDRTMWHPSCFICTTCKELLVDLTYCVHDDLIYCERHYAEQLKPRCAACDELIFSGEYTKAMSKDWHSGHFSCWQCDESLTGQRYVLRDDHPYCIKCYESVFANACEECNKTIGIDSKDLSYKDKHWHEACFLCHKCRVSLVDKQFGSKADKIYCGNCYDSQFASRCDGCGEIFRAGTKKMEYKTRQWHEKCFCCVVCKTAIGTKSFIPREQEIYCATCYEEKFATRCVKCNKIITSGGVTYKNEPWHRECFTCTNCNTSLAGQRFTSRDEKPYCADCFGELFAKRCTSCSRPITGIGGTRFISFEDRHWHNDCFICALCKTSLVGRGFITDGDDIICPECAKQKLM